MAKIYRLENNYLIGTNKTCMYSKERKKNWKIDFEMGNGRRRRNTIASVSSNEMERQYFTTF